ncbi:MAG: zeta toxin family protein [Phycisphaerae bacterium]|nr:zeta toxin family protein [Phycisphaerae bacterium]
MEPKCIIVSGRPGSGKTTLAGELSRRLYLPKLSRDEIKEGYVSTFNVKHDRLPEDTNGKVNEVFFETTLYLLKGNVSVVIEAAFQHKLWCLVVPRIQEVARPYIVICELDAETSARRHLERGLEDPNREFFHGDRRVSLYRETGQFQPGGEYDAPHFDVPTLRVSTCDGYRPGLEKIEDFIGGVPNRAAGGDVQ